MAEPPARLGRYKLGARIAAGGMGEVYHAVQEGLGGFQKPVVLKLLLEHLAQSQEAVDAFLSEAQLAAAMNHPNVVQIFDVGVDQGRYFIAMEWVRGVSMSAFIDALAQRDCVPAPELVEYVSRELCEGLYYAHTFTRSDGQPMRLIHRDVTPHNVLLSVSGEVKLTDFGIAKTRDSARRTEPGTVRGKLEYMSPEQLNGAPLDARADQFGLAVTLFSLATLQSPFRRTQQVDVYKAVMLEPLPSLSRARPDLPLPLVAALGRAAAKTATARFASVQELRDALPEVDAKRARGLLSQLVGDLSGDAPVNQAASRPVAPAWTRGTVAMRAVAAPAPTRRPRLWPLGVALAALGATGVLASRWLRSDPAVAPPGSAPVVWVQPAPSPAPPPPGVESPAPVPAPAPHPSAAPPKAVGYLSVDAEPWAVVTVNGSKIGETPLDQFPCVEGPATVKFFCPDTRKSAERRVVISRGRTTTVDVDLR